MHFLVVGCGKTGARLCGLLSDMEHTVTVVDTDPARFTNLPKGFAGGSIAGTPTDPNVLKQAGIAGCGGLAAMTPNDNLNIMVCQIAGELFRVPRVLSRIQDPDRADSYAQLGLHTISPSDLTIHAFYSFLTRNGQTETLSFGPAAASFQTVCPSSRQIGQPVSQLLANSSDDAVLFGLLRQNGTLLLAHPGLHETVKPDDLLLMASVVE